MLYPPLEDFLNRRVMGCFNRIPLAAVLRTNHRRAMEEAGRLEANTVVWVREVGAWTRMVAVIWWEVVRFWMYLMIKLSGFTNRLNMGWEREKN